MTSVLGINVRQEERGFGRIEVKKRAATEATETIQF
jgi:hypothetical protein